MTKKKAQKKKKYFSNVESKNKNTHFTIRRKTFNKLHKHCVSLWIASSTELIHLNESKTPISIDLSLKKPTQIRSGTLTFVTTQGKYYGITCNHVIKQLEIQNNNTITEFLEQGLIDEKTAVNLDYKAYKLVISTKKYTDLSNFNFIQPNAQYPHDKPDIRIAKLDKSIIEGIGKVAIDIDCKEEVPENLQFAIALGFPENLKRQISLDKSSHQILMPHNTIIAELQSNTPKERFTLYSQLDVEIERNFSGMSGGPIFWMEKMNYNILGIIYESPNTQYDAFTKKDLMICGELATPSIIKKWINELEI